MSLLDKFAKVEVNADTRISEDDKKFCCAHQAAYNEARTTLQELKFCWESVLEAQKQILHPVGETNFNLYLSDHSNFTISVRDIDRQLQKSHSTLISKIVHHINRAYSISIDKYDVEDALLPKAPKSRLDDGYEEAHEKHKEQMLNMSLDYRQIIEQIFVQTDGRGLWEQAEYYIKLQCHEGAWRYNKPTYERKKHTIQFSNAVSSDRYLFESTKHILRGLALFETGKVSNIPKAFSCLMEQCTLHTDSFDFADCTKVKRLRIYRNGRMDIRFAEEAHTVKFIDTFLGVLP